MRFTCVLSVACLLVLAGCATSLPSNGALPSGESSVLADGTTPLQVVADQSPVFANRVAQAPSLVRLVSDDPLDDLGAPPVPPAPGMPGDMPMPDDMPRVGAPARAPAAFPAPRPAPVPEDYGADCYFPAPARRVADEPPPMEAPVAPRMDEEIMEEMPLEEIEPPMPEMDAPSLRRSGCGGCDQPSCNSCADPCCEKGYAGIGLSIFPGFGAGMEFGLTSTSRSWATWSYELGMQWQDQYADFNSEPGNGDMIMFRLGTRVQFSPRSRAHLTGRVGVAWVNATGTPGLNDFAHLDYAGDYIGVYAGIGYEWEIGRRWSTGPEAMFFAGYAVNTERDRTPGRQSTGRDEFGYFAMLIWHINYRF